MLRARMSAVVRSRPVHRSGRKNDRDWSFFSVEALDEDFNKVSLTLGDEVDPTQFGEGVKLDLVVDVVSAGGRLRATVVEVVEPAAAKRPAA